MAVVGIAGYGFMGKFHHAAYRAVAPDALKAVYDVNPQAFSTGTTGNIGTAEVDLSGVQTFTDYDDFLKSVEVVDICAPTPFHREMAIKALEAGKHVLLEKPMALTLEDCRAILTAARSAGTTFMVAHCVRFWPGCDTLIEAAKDGRWGKLLGVVFTRVSGCAFWSPWFADESKSGGAVVDLLIHDFDLCRVLGGMPRSVTATGTVDGLGPGSGVNAATVLLEPEKPDGPSLAVTGGWFPSENYPFAMRFTAQFEAGVLQFASDKPEVVMWYPRKGEGQKIEVPQTDGYQEEIKYFLSILGGKPDRCLPEESRDAVAVALAAREAVRAGKPVTPQTE